MISLLSLKERFLVGKKCLFVHLVAVVSCLVAAHEDDIQVIALDALDEFRILSSFFKDISEGCNFLIRNIRACAYPEELGEASGTSCGSRSFFSVPRSTSGMNSPVEK